MSDPIEQLFSAYPAEVQAVASKLRRMIRGVMPQARERIYHGAVSYSLGPSGRDWIVYLALLED